MVIQCLGYLWMFCRIMAWHWRPGDVRLKLHNMNDVSSQLVNNQAAFQVIHQQLFPVYLCVNCFLPLCCSYLQRSVICQGAIMAELVAWLATYVQHLGSNPSRAMSEGCFIFHFTSVPLEVDPSIQPTFCTKMGLKQQHFVTSQVSWGMEHHHLPSYLYSVTHSALQ